MIVADTRSHTGDAARAEIKQIQRECALISKFTEMPLHEWLIETENSYAKLLEKLEELSLNPDDCFLFYFVGHGYRTSDKKGPWPLLYFSQEEACLDLEWIIESVKAKKPRFALVVADCCNNIMDGIVTIGRFPLGYIHRDLSKGYRTLFLHSQGLVVVVAAKPGDYAFCYEQGHLYSEAFWKALRIEITSLKANWRSLLDKTADFLASIQTPYDEIILNTPD